MEDRCAKIRETARKIGISTSAQYSGRKITYEKVVRTMAAAIIDWQPKGHFNTVFSDV